MGTEVKIAGSSRSLILFPSLSSHIWSVLVHTYTYVIWLQRNGRHQPLRYRIWGHFLSFRRSKKMRTLLYYYRRALFLNRGFYKAVFFYCAFWRRLCNFQKPWSYIEKQTSQKNFLKAASKLTWLCWAHSWRLPVPLAKWARSALTKRGMLHTNCNTCLHRRYLWSDPYSSGYSSSLYVLILFLYHTSKSFDPF